MAFNGISAAVDAEVSYGRYQYSSFRKVPSQTTVAGIWVDLSMCAGNPVPNYYASEPLVSAVLTGRKGIYHGQDVGGGEKLLTELTLVTVTAAAVPLALYLCDYLLYYPFVDMDSTDEQFFNAGMDPQNIVNLPRYTTGQGVRAFLVAVTPYTGGQDFQINYTNQDGTSGRKSQICTANTGTYISSLVTSGVSARNYGCFIPLQAGDTGIRSVESITFFGGNGGLGALVLCKPLATTEILAVNAPVVRNFVVDCPSLPKIYNGAYLNFLAFPAGSLAAAPIFGMANFIWNS